LTTPVTPAGFALSGAILHNAANLNFAPGMHRHRQRRAAKLEPDGVGRRPTAAVTIAETKGG
jgi:hypothetical protein